MFSKSSISVFLRCLSREMTKWRNLLVVQLLWRLNCVWPIMVKSLAKRLIFGPWALPCTVWSTANRPLPVPIWWSCTRWSSQSRTFTPIRKKQWLTSAFFRIEYSGSLNPDLLDLLQRLLEKDPEKRITMPALRVSGCVWDRQGIEGYVGTSLGDQPWSRPIDSRRRELRDDGDRDHGRRNQERHQKHCKHIHGGKYDFFLSVASQKQSFRWRLSPSSDVIRDRYRNSRSTKWWKRRKNRKKKQKAWII